MKNLKYILVALAAVTAMTSFVGCSDDKSKTSDSKSDVVYYDNTENTYADPVEAEEHLKANAVISEGKMNEAVQVSGFSINVQEVDSLGIREPDGLRPFEAERIAVKLEITNNNSEAARISALRDIVINVDGTEISSIDQVISIYAANVIEGYSLLPNTLEAGQSASGYIAFEVTPEWKEMIISYDPITENNNYDAAEYKITPDMVKSN